MDPNVQQNQSAVSSEPVQPQVLQSSQKTSPLLKMVLSILGVVIVLGLIEGAYYLGTQKTAPIAYNQKPSTVNSTEAITSAPTAVVTSASSEVTNWKTYASPNYGYSFQYPNTWYLYPPQKTTTDLDLQTVSPASYATIDTDGVPAGDYIDVFVDDNSKNLSIQEWAKQQLQIPIKLTTQTINGNVWYRTTDYPFFIGGEAAFIIQNGKVFDIAWTKTGKNLSISSDEFHGILSSFKFNN